MPHPARATRRSGRSRGRQFIQVYGVGMVDRTYSSATLLRVVRSSQIDEDPAHDLGRCSEEMRPVLPVGTLGIHQMKVGLVHQGGGLESMTPTLVPHVPPGDTA